MIDHVTLPVCDYRRAKTLSMKTLAAGAKENGKPGYRTDYYAAFVRDADGHNIEAVRFDYSKAKR